MSIYSDMDCLRLAPALITLIIRSSRTVGLAFLEIRFLTSMKQMIYETVLVVRCNYGHRKIRGKP